MFLIFLDNYKVVRGLSHVLKLLCYPYSLTSAIVARHTHVCLEIIHTITPNLKIVIPRPLCQLILAVQLVRAAHGKPTGKNSHLLTPEVTHALVGFRVRHLILLAKRVFQQSHRKCVSKMPSASFAPSHYLCEYM